MKKRAMHRTTVLEDQTPEVGPGRSGLRWNSRGAAILVCAIAVLAVVVWYSGVFWIDVLPGLALDGATVAVWFALAGMMGWGILGLVGPEAGKDPRPVLAIRIVTAVAMGLGVWSLLALGMGLAGWLNRWTIWILPLSSVAVWASRVRFSARWGNPTCAEAHPTENGGGTTCAEAHPTTLLARIEGWLKEPAGWGWLWLAAMPALGIAIAAASIAPGLLWKFSGDPHPYDVLIYHMQVPREWYDAGRIVPLMHNVYCFFPFGMEMQYLLAMHLRGGPWAAMYLCQFLSLGCMLMAVAGVYAAAKEATKAYKGSGVIAGVIAASVPWIVMLSSLPYIESAMLMYCVLAIAWTIRAVRSEGGRVKQMAIAGAMAGFACGTKYTGVTVLISVPVAAMVVWGWMRWRMRREGNASGFRELLPSPQPSPLKGEGDRTPAPRHSANGDGVLLACVVAVVVGAVVFSPWLIRNFAWTGNPVFPMAGKLLGQARFDDVQMHRWDVAHRARADQSSIAARFTALGTQVIGHWQFGYVLFPAAVIVMLIWLRRPDVLLLAILFAGQVLFWVFFTHLQPRFAVLIVPIGAIVIGACLSGRLIPIGAGVAVLAACVGLFEMDACFREYLPFARAGLFRNADLTFAQTPQLAGAEKGGKRVAMIGEGQPFFVQMPSKWISYRTIFDVRFEKGKSPIDCWLGESLEQLKRDYDVVIIHPGELRRLARTYADVPMLSDNWLAEVVRVYGIKPPYPAEWANPDAPIVLPLQNGTTDEHR